MEELAVHIAGILEECLSRKMQLPFVVCVASPNGSVVAMRYVQSEGALGTMVLVNHTEEGGLRPPITCMILDQTGEAVRVTIDRGAATFH